MGANVDRLERTIAARLGIEQVVAVSNCTAALHLAMVVSGIGPGDEVILPSLTFVATANAIRYVGATPVFADVSSAVNPTLDPFDAEIKITPRTKALLPVHYAGFPCNMAAITTVAQKHGLKVIEDAAHAIDVSYGNRKLGTIGDVGCFSLFANKVITSGEGGFMAVRDPEAVRQLRLLRSHGMTTVSWDRAQGHATSYDVVAVGYNYRMDDIRAALALAQFEKLDGILNGRMKIRSRYMELLRGMNGVIVPFENFEGASSNYIFPIVLKEGGAERRELVRAKLKEAGVQTSVHYPAVHRFSVYHQNGNLPETEHIADHEITLPLFDSLTNDEQAYIADCLRSAIASF